MLARRGLRYHGPRRHYCHVAAVEAGRPAPSGTRVFWIFRANQLTN